jgi:hypothetical protein
VLAEGIEVSGARLDNGLLHIDLVRPEVESKVRTIAITDGPTSDGSGRTPGSPRAGTKEHARLED